MSKRTFSFIPQMVSVEEVLNLLKSLPDGKSTGNVILWNIFYFAMLLPRSQHHCKTYLIGHWKNGHLQMFGSMLKCAQSRKTAKNPPITPANSQPINLLPSLSKIIAWLELPRSTVSAVIVKWKHLGATTAQPRNGGHTSSQNCTASC
jgi:hypothetical protein